jgi:hypothetical protein
MPQKKERTQADASTELLRDLLIVALAKSDVPQLEIRKIVGCDIRKVNRIAKHIRKEKRHE